MPVTVTILDRRKVDLTEGARAGKSDYLVLYQTDVPPFLPNWVRIPVEQWSEARETEEIRKAEAERARKSPRTFTL